MACNDCGKKVSRHGSSPVIPSGDVDSSPQEVPGQGFSPINQARTPMDSFLEAKKLTYEELVERRKFQEGMADQQREHIMSQMTDAMRRIHVDELVAVINCDRMGVPGMTPEQAVVSLQETLERPEFSFIDDIYPTLRSSIRERYESFFDNKIIL